MMEAFVNLKSVTLMNDNEAEVIAFVPNGEDALTIFGQATGRKNVKLAEMDILCDHRVNLRDRIWVFETKRGLYHCIGADKIKMAVIK